VEHEFRLDLLPPMKVKGKATELEVFLVSERAPSEQARPAEALQGQLRTLEAPPKAAGYAPVEPVPDAKSDSTS
jgi:hypothetical protein